ncbi:MAG: hypothetical protein IJT87_03690 [Ruminiclostridium sp.]|nr:hypothetical protein [Ruminiclostridium sp.]
MKNVIRFIIGCSAACFAVMLILHRRVIAAYLTGGEMPVSDKCPVKCCKHCGKDE